MGAIEGLQLNIPFSQHNNKNCMKIKTSEYDVEEKPNFTSVSFHTHTAARTQKQTSPPTPASRSTISLNDDMKSHRENYFLFNAIRFWATFVWRIKKNERKKEERNIINERERLAQKIKINKWNKKTEININDVQLIQLHHICLWLPSWEVFLIYAFIQCVFTNLIYRAISFFYFTFCFPSFFHFFSFLFFFIEKTKRKKNVFTECNTSWDKCCGTCLTHHLMILYSICTQCGVLLLWRWWIPLPGAHS